MAAQSSDTSAAQPLIPGPSVRSDTAEDERHLAHGERKEDDESSLVSPGLFVWLLTICAGISGLLFGYEYVHTYPVLGTSGTVSDID